MTDKKQLTINMAVNLCYMFINYAITFFLTSYIVSNIGGEAYGFIGLCNNIINYATLITVALNSVAGRFITIEVHRGNMKKANEYFTSTLIADLCLSGILLLIFGLIAENISEIFNIPYGLLLDIKRLFMLSAINLVISIITTVFTVSTFITNKLYLSSLANLAGIIVRAVVLIILFNLLPANITYVGFATVISTVTICIINISYTRKLCPQLLIASKYISILRTKELFMSGIWSSVTKLSQILSDGMDLLFSNLWIGSYAMGQLSIAYTLPTFVAQFFSMIINLFNPKLTEHYAKEKKDEIVEEIKLNMKLTGFFGNVIFFGIILMGKKFFRLWVPTADLNLVYRLAVIASTSVLVSSVCSPLSNVFLITNKLRINSLVWLAVSIFDAILVISLISITNLGVYAVAGVSKFTALIVYLTFWPLYSSRCLQIESSSFYKIIGRYFVVTVIGGCVMFAEKLLLWNCKGWADFIVQTILLAIAGLATNYLLFLNKKERKCLTDSIQKRLFLKRG